MHTSKIVDLSGVSPQETFLESNPEKPSATSMLYIKRFTTMNADKSQEHTVVGVHIVLAKGNQNGLWEVLHIDRNTQKLDPLNPQVTTRSLQICCDTLEVHGELSLPETDVAIFARRLVWMTADAAINTSPLPWAVPKAQNASGSNPGKNGACGRNAGAFKLFVSEVEPADDSRPRLIALGGCGQDPGAGLDGKRGKSMISYSSVPFSITDSGISTSKATVNFNPVAVYIDYEWRWAASRVSGPHYIGENSFPASGGNAVAPGTPGDGGDGGGLTTNLAAVVPSFKNTCGQAGTKERDYWGGAPGTPTSCAKYKVKLWENLFGTSKASYEVKQTDLKTTEKGVDAKAQGATKGAGSTPMPKIADESNAWLHPLGLQKSLEYARDLFLGGDRVGAQELLYAYEGALALPVPDNSAWDDGSMAHWTAAQSEVAAMLQRLRGHLDYFGNAAGYTPLLSLQGTIKLYAEETRRALRTLLLVSWIDAKERDAKEAANALGDAITVLNDDTRQAAAQVAGSEAKISDVTNRIDALEQELNGMSNQLEILRNNLLSKAQSDLQQQAQIKFAIKMAAAVCQVVPVGQPALGTVGSLASVATDFIGDDGTKAPDTVSKMGDVLSKAREAAKKANEASQKAAKEKGATPSKDVQSAKANASAWAQVGDGLGPALSQVSQGLKALQVPKSEIEAELQRLESESVEWNKLVMDIRALNERKYAFVRDLVDAFQSLGDGYARISSNAAAVLSMHQQRSKEIGKVDPEATGFVQQMGQRSRLNLIWYLYLMVKAYETTVLKPINVDWKLSEVTDKINDLLKPEDGFDAATLNQQVKVLTPLYQKNIDTVRNKLLQDFSFNENTITLRLGLSRKQTPVVMDALNEGGQVVIDPLGYGLILFDQELARLSDVTLKMLKFDPDGPQLPATHNVVVSLQPGHTGTIRKSEALYSVYSDLPLQWSWTYLASGEISASKPSKGAEDMLNMVLGNGAENIKQKVSLPPVWSDIVIKVLYSPLLPINQKPRITSLYFEFSCDVTSAPDYQRVLNVQSLGSTGGAVIQCSPDIAKRGNGFYRMFRIYSQGASVRLSVPSHVAGSAFDSWDLIGNKIDQIGVKKTDVEIKLDDHVLAQCHWSQSQVREQPVVLSRTLAPADISEIAESHRDENIRRELREALSVVLPARDLPIRVEAREGASVVGLVPMLNDAEVVEKNEEGWKLVNYRGIVGWVKA
jgi:hypothetical protein